MATTAFFSHARKKKSRAHLPHWTGIIVVVVAAGNVVVVDCVAVWGGKPQARTKMSSKISAFFKAAPKPDDPAAACTTASTGFELRFARATRVVEWDTGLFNDCRPSEADDAMEETLRVAKRYDHREHDDKGFGSALNFKQVYATVEEANAAAKHNLEHVLLHHPADRQPAKQEDVANGDLPHGYQLPPSDSVAKVTLGSGGRGTYTGCLSFFCDPYGSDVWTVCVTRNTRSALSSKATARRRQQSPAAQPSARRRAAKPSKRRRSSPPSPSLPPRNQRRPHQRALQRRSPRRSHVSASCRSPA